MSGETFHKRYLKIYESMFFKDKNTKPLKKGCVFRKMHKYTK